MSSSEIQFRSIFGTDDYSNILQLSDAQLHTEDGCFFDVHRVILARSNDYFRALFCGIAKDRRSVLIPGVSGESLGQILIYIYMERICLTDRNITDVMVAADYLLVDRLFKEVKANVKDKITLANSLSLLVDAHQISCPDIYDDAFRFIQTHFNAIVHNQKTLLAELPLNILKQFLCNASLYIFEERLAWLVIVEWVQRDVDKRLSYVPLLLKYLARKEIDEDLSKDIMNHKIVAENPYCKTLNRYKSRNVFDANLDTLQHFLRIHSNHRVRHLDYRSPSKLHVIAKKISNDDFYDCCEIYVTYDEHLDLWRKAAEVDFHPYHVIAIRNNVYLFDSDGSRIFSLDLKENKLNQVNYFGHHRNFYSAVKLGHFIYVLGNVFHNLGDPTYDTEVFDAEDNRWIDGTSSFTVNLGEAACISGNIYLVGCMTNTSRMVTQVYDPESHTWTLLPSPKIFRFNFALTAFHEKLFVIGGTNRNEDIRNVEVFDPKIKKWSEVQELPICYDDPKAVVLNDRLVVYEEDPDDEEEKKCNLAWNEYVECWVKLDDSNSMKNLHLYRFCDFDDAETIRGISRGKKHFNSALQRSDFN